ncbi:hypothetical protein ADK67_23975 [Saccharothrix sp. NRRL B-16348]|nr:hypothetical protein ADK67_23975 [Saccharothrix sp. NRRL B-16348]
MMALAPSSASAASLAAPAPTGYAVDRSAVPACHVTPKSGVSGVNVRLRANDDSTRLGIIQPGQQAPAACEATSGGSYTACGGTSDWWVQVKWDGRTGYVAQLCVDWYSS